MEPNILKAVTIRAVDYGSSQRLGTRILNADCDDRFDQLLLEEALCMQTESELVGSPVRTYSQDKGSVSPLPSDTGHTVIEEGPVAGCRWRQTHRLIHSAHFLVRLVEDNWLRQSSWVHIVHRGTGTWALLRVLVWSSKKSSR